MSIFQETINTLNNTPGVYNSIQEAGAALVLARSHLSDALGQLLVEFNAARNDRADAARAAADAAVRAEDLRKAALELAALGDAIDKLISDTNPEETTSGSSDVADPDTDAPKTTEVPGGTTGNG